MYIWIDEVGYGSIAGPVLTCAVAADPNHPPIKGVKDSKQLSKHKREDLYVKIIEEVDYEFGAASPKRIEKMNIHYARYYAMKLAIEKLVKRGIQPEKVIVDGKFPIPDLSLLQEPVIKADEKYWQCGAASILAKVKRDSIMANLATIDKYSHYDWQNNAGYFVEQTHKWGVVEFGGTILHRNNFGYYQYCLFCRKKYEEFLEQGKTLKDYKQFEIDETKKYGKSFYSIWKSGEYDCWKIIKQGEKTTNNFVL
ncbi:MAG: ribonuclease HII [Patescibacteria group bacterium]|jgi:ribonuclease HII